MEKKVLLSIGYDNKGDIEAVCPNTDELIIAVTNEMKVQLAHRKQEWLDVVFAICVHLLASDTSGEFERQFIKNLKAATPQYRGIYRQMEQKMRKNSVAKKDKIIS